MYPNSPFGRTHYITGMLHVWHDSQGLDIYNPNAPYAQARMKIVDGKPKLIMNYGAPTHFRNRSLRGKLDFGSPRSIHCMGRRFARS